ncbi:MAG: ectonucleotide pyrophosphatase/phosphodiesterase [Bacteroidales bacterium]|nr:ectonucleotide pyrophosphatase/phosphodiesterase [Bacteroidales bacterium]
MATQKFLKVIPAFFALFFLFSLAQCNSNHSRPYDDVYVVMLSMDGFRWDYADRVPTPNLDFIAANGVKAEYVVPAFPSNTFPNHYTMATGLYPDNHGIVNNNFYCPVLDMTYRMRDREAVENGDFYGGEPIWVTAEKQGVTAASYFWVGSEAPVQGMQPSYWKIYDHSHPFAARIDTVAYWLNLPKEQRPQLITFYFNEPDSEGHRSGPESSEIDELVMELDALVGYLLETINALPIADNINLIVTSDHGMTERSTERHIDLGQYIERDWIELAFGGNPTMLWQAREGMLDSIYNRLKDVEHMYIWKTGELPERLNFGHNPRTLDLVVMADSTWNIGWGAPTERFYSGGGHGWDNMKKDMHTIFYATGPAFRSNHTHPPFELVDLYPLIAHILNLEPAVMDGRLERVQGMLK